MVEMAAAAEASANGSFSSVAAKSGAPGSSSARAASLLLAALALGGTR
jgi:hypothetical protein